MTVTFRNSPPSEDAAPAPASTGTEALTRGPLAARDTVLCQISPLPTSLCGQILLPNRCHKDQGPTAVSGNRASDLHLPGQVFTFGPELGVRGVIGVPPTG